jgi:hypothetical protein
MTRTHAFSFASLNVTANDIEEFIGYQPGSSLDAFKDHYETALAKAADVCQIIAGYRLFDDVEITKKSILIDGTSFSTGSIVSGQLKGSSGIAVFVCTAGHGISELAKEMTTSGDVVMAYMYDVIGSLCAEKAADRMESLLLKEFKNEGNGLSNRCSPGYCGWDVGEQRKLFSLLPEGFCGVTLSASSLMTPIKSVSGIIGYGAKVGKMERPCKKCNHTQCISIANSRFPIVD